MKRKILIGILILIVVGGSVGYYLYSKQEPDITQGPPDVSVTAKDLITAFEKDTATAGKTYVGKVVEVIGTVKSVDTSGAVVMGEDGTASEVTIGLDRRHVEDAKIIKVGNVAVLQGRCSGYTKSSGDPDDLLASLGTTVELRSGGIKNKK